MHDHRQSATKFLLILVTIGAILFTLFPFYWMLRTSVAPPADERFAGLSLLPENPTLGNYAQAWDQANLGTAIRNGLIVTLTIMGLQIVTIVPAAFALVRYQFRGKGVVLGVVLVALIVPTQATAIPNFLTVSRLGLADSLPGLILPFATSAFGVFLLYRQLLKVPSALWDAATADNLGVYSQFRIVVLPYLGGAIAAFALVSFYVHWNDFLWPLLIVRSDGNLVPSLTLALFQRYGIGFDWGNLCAGAAIITVPVVLVFVAAQDRFTAGLVGTEVNG